jgi:hypothetical protein
MSTEAVTIDFAKMDGLAPAIVQDARSGEVLMVGFVNEISYAKTLESGFVTFWSRTRQKLLFPLRPIATMTPCSSRWKLKATAWSATKEQ